jgi:hypothetical protein
MSQWSNFAPFGEFAFSGSDSESEKIYNAQTKALGPAFEGAVGEAETYADSMCFGAARLQLQAAGAQDDPTQVSYLIDALERDWRVFPSTGDTIGERRAALAFAMAASTGSFTTAVTAGLTALLGSLFVHFRAMDRDILDEVSLSSAYPPHSPLTNTAIKSIIITTAIMPGAMTVAYTRVLDDGNAILPGEKVVVNPGVNGLEDVVEVTASTPTTFTATFTLPQDANVPARTGPYTRWTSNQRHSLVVVDESVLTNNPLLVKTHEYMRRVMPSVSTWIVCAETIPGIVGPFTVGQGLIGQTPLGGGAIMSETTKAGLLPYEDNDGAYVIAPFRDSGENYGIAGGAFTETGSPVYTADGLVLDGVDDFVWIDQGVVPTTYTVVFHAKFPVISTGLFPCVFYCNDYAALGGGVSVNRTTYWDCITNNGVESVPSVVAAGSGWHTFAIVQGASNRKFYLDGALIHTSTATPTSMGQYLKLGGESSGSTKAQLVIRNLVSYSSALSDANRELVELWAASDGLLTEVPPPPPS